MTVGLRLDGQNSEDRADEGLKVFQVVEHLRVVGASEREAREVARRVLHEVRRGGIRDSDRLLAQLVLEHRRAGVVVDGHVQSAAGLHEPPELEEPAVDEIVDVSEDRTGIDEVEEAILEGQVGNEAAKNALVDFLLSLTDERVRWEKAPFDHPELFVPNGTMVTDKGTLRTCDDPAVSCDTLLRIPPVGAAGLAAEGLPPLGTFLEADPHQP